MNQFLLQQENSAELKLFPHILELGAKKMNTVQLNYLKSATNNCIRFYYILDGKHDWLIDGKNYQLFPGDVAFLLPNQSFGGTKEFLEMGTICWLTLSIS